MKILIADDEELVRENLRDVLFRVVPDAELFEAVNGRTLIDKTEEIGPDVCFVDIRMPGISGLEAIERLTGSYPNISWVILSGYSDFEYARKAINLGVLEYLVKPAVEEEVRAVLDAATRRKTEGVQLKREKFESKVSAVLNNTSAEEFDDYLSSIEYYSAMLLIISQGNDESTAAWMLKKLFSEIRETLDRQGDSCSAGLFNTQDGFPAIIAGGKNPGRMLSDFENSLQNKQGLTIRKIRTEEKETLTGLFECMDGIIRNYELENASGETETDSDKSLKLVRQAEIIVQKRFSQQIGIAQIAEELNITPNYLSTLFKKYNGIPFTKYITDIRLGRAEKLLDIPGITVKEAASRLGYQSSRHFSRLFREYYGMTPSDYLGLIK